MVGTFGLLSDNHASHFPADRLVENRTRLDAFELNRIGALVEGATTELRWGERRYQLSRQGANLLVDGIRISVTWTEWAVPWFLCPACGQRCKHLYLGELLCRTCCHLDYACRHRHRSIPGLYRIKQLRRRISADERPFSPLPRRQRRHLRYPESLMRSGCWRAGSSAIWPASIAISSAASESASRRANGSHTESPGTFRPSRSLISHKKFWLSNSCRNQLLSVPPK